MFDRNFRDPDGTRVTGRRTGRARGSRKFRSRPTLAALEARQLMAVVPGPIVPGQIYQEVAFYDSNGDTVEVKINGPTSGGRGFMLRLAGDATNLADVQSIHLVGLTADNGLSVVATPNQLTISAGGDFGKLYSSGYTNVASITADAGVTGLGGVLLSGAIVDDVRLPGVAVSGITLDTGMTVFVDTVNTATLNSINVSAPAITITNPITGEAEIFDESPTGPVSGYNPSAGLIDLWDVEAASIGSIVINGVISADTKDPYDESKLTNDLRGVVSVSGEIGSIVAPRSAMRNAVRAGGIGSVRLGQVDGEFTTTDASKAMTFYIPKQFSGSLHAAGHLNLGFTSASGELVTAMIWAGGGISGSAPEANDRLVVPDKFATSVYNASTTVGIADVEIDGAAMARWYSASRIGNVTAKSFDAGSLFEAATDIGDVEMTMTTKASTAATGGVTQTAVELDGFFKAGGNIGNVKSATGIMAQLIAGGNIGDITGVSGGLTSTVVLAGGSIGAITVYQASPSTTEIKAGGDLGDVRLYSGDLGWKIKVGGSIGDVTLDAGALSMAVLVAGVDLGDVTVTSPTAAAIEGGSLIAGRNIGLVSAYAFSQTAVHGVLIQAGNRIEGVTGISYGSTILPSVSAGIPSSVADTYNGIDKAQILAPEIGPILGQAYVGTGLYKVVVHAQVGDVDSITGIGNGDGIYESIVVAEGGIGPIWGLSTVLGSGIEGGSFDANGKFAASDGTMGQIVAQGGPAGGHGVHLTRFQASNRIAGLDAVSNANGGDAINGISTYAVSYGTIRALVLGGQTGNGIVDASLRAWTDYENNRPDVQVDAVRVDVRSGLGVGISGSTFQIKGSLLSLESKALNGSAIYNSLFSISQGDFGRIYAESINGGTAIDSSTFIASNGSITSARDQASARDSGITAIASGTSLLANAIARSTFSADGNIGVIDAMTKGGSAILDSTFVADADYGNASNGPDFGPASDDEGAIFGIYAKTSGQNLASSAGISGSNFEGESIRLITVEVTDREEGGAGISNSIFLARNAVYDGAGNFNNRGAIGPITVVDRSLRGNGIEYSRFLAGAAGSIGDINVQVLGGAGIKGSEFRASLFDYDQAEFTGKIGNITVVAGRSGNSVLLPLPAPPNDAWTLLPAGIDGSYFAADAGIGDVTVNSLGTGVFFSAFLADFDVISRLAGIPEFILPLLAQDTPGDLGNITITANGRFGAGSVLSLYTGRSVGDIVIRVASRDTQPTTLARPAENTLVGTALDAVANMLGFSLAQSIGPAASAASLYLATNGDLGRIYVQNAGAGFDSILSAYIALPNGSYGPVAPMDAAWGNFFWEYPRVSGAPSSPTVSATALAPTAAGAQQAGGTIYLHANFSGPVTVSGVPTFSVMVGATERTARYVGGSGTSQLTFAVQTEAGDSGRVTAPAGVAIRTDFANRIVDAATGLPVTALSPSADGLAGVQVEPPPPPVPVDSTPPVVTAVSAIESSAGRYAPGVVLTIRITFSEIVQVLGQPTIPLTIRTLSRSFVFSGGSGTNTLSFSYTLTRADVQARAAAKTTGRIVLTPGAAILDLAGNAASLPAAAASQSASASGPAGTAAPRLGAAHPRGAAAIRPQAAFAKKATPIRAQAAAPRARPR